MSLSGTERNVEETNKSCGDPVEQTSHKYLKEASMKRLNMKIRNAQETLGKQLIFCKNVDTEELEPSGLNVLEAEHVSRWVAGTESGRHCMLALLECHRIETDLHKANKSDKPVRFQDRNHLTSGAVPRSIQLTSLGKSVSLPDQFLCDSGALYDSIFSRPPSAVLKEGLQILAEFASERSSTALTTEQINLGLKQIRVEKMIDVPGGRSDSSSEEAAGKENVDTTCNTSKQKQPADDSSGKGAASGVEKDAGGAESRNTVEAYRLQIIIELLRLHIIKSTREQQAADDCQPRQQEAPPQLHSAFFTPSSDSSNPKKKRGRNKKRRKKVVPKIEQLFDSNISLQQHWGRASDEEDEEEAFLQAHEQQQEDETGGVDSARTEDTGGGEDFESSGEGVEEEEEEEHDSFTLYTIHPAPQELQTQLARRKEQHLQEAETLSERELSASNRVLLPYISQLMALKGSLGGYLDYLEGSKAYLSFGLDKDCDAAALKKAYRAKAVKLHPDKKGGDKAKFQQLNDMYNDMLKVKMEESVMSEEVEAEWAADLDTIGRAQDIVSKLEGYVLDIKTATTACTELAQASMRWKKRVEKAGKLPCPKGIRRLIKLMKSTGAEKGKDKDKDAGNSATVQDSSCLLAEEHLQIVSVTVSLIVSELMALLSLGRYGVSTSKNIHVMKSIEHLATCGLNVQKCTSTLAPIEAQIASLLPRAELSYELSQSDAGVHDVLVQMFNTSFHTRHLTVGMAADTCVTVALAAAELCLAVKQIIKLSDQEFKANLKRNVKQREQEDEYCEEDRAFMAEMAEKQHKASCEQAREKEAQKEQEEARHREEGTEMEYLRTQVHSLQVQLRLQNMEALQTLNADVCAMQKKVQGHVSEVTVLDAKPPSGDEDCSGNCDVSGEKGSSVAGEVRDAHGRSLMSLLAEFIDSSCVSFLNKHQRAGKKAIALTSAVSSNRALVMNLFDEPFGWMFALNRRQQGMGGEASEEDKEAGGTSKGGEGPAMSSLDEHTHSDDNDEKKDDSSSNEKPSMTSTRLALYPDFRSKVLWVCAMLDFTAVRGMIENELQSRLLGCVQAACTFKVDQAYSSKEAGIYDNGAGTGAGNRDCGDKAVRENLQRGLARAVCSCMLDGVTAAVQDMQ